MKINKIVLCVKDLEESIKFYQEAFGFELLMTKEGGMGAGASLKCGDLFLTLMTSPKLPVGIIALGTDTEDVGQALDELKGKGARVIMEPTQVGMGTIGKIWDPNDISIHVMSGDMNGQDSGKRLTHLPNKVK